MERELVMAAWRVLALVLAAGILGVMIGYHLRRFWEGRTDGR